MADSHLNNGPGLESPCERAAAVTPADGADLANTSRALWIGTAGDVKVTTKQGDTVTFVGATGWMPIRAARVWSTGTTASNILAVW